MRSSAVLWHAWYEALYVIEQSGVLWHAWYEALYVIEQSGVLWHAWYEALYVTEQSGVLWHAWYEALYVIEQSGVLWHAWYEALFVMCLVHWCWLLNGAVCEDVIIYRWTAMKMRSAPYSWLSVTCAWCDCLYLSIYVSTYACINLAIHCCQMHIWSTCLLVHKTNKLLSLSLSSQCRPFSRRHTRIHVFSQGIRRFALRTGRNRQLFTEKQFKGGSGYLHRTIIPSHIDHLSSLSSERLIFASSSF